MIKVNFKPFSEITEETGWQYKQNVPVGQQWNCRENFITNGRGEGFTIHGGTKHNDKCRIVDALNERDAEIAKLKNDAVHEGGENGK